MAAPLAPNNNATWRLMGASGLITLVVLSLWLSAPCLHRYSFPYLSFFVSRPFSPSSPLHLHFLLDPFFRSSLSPHLSFPTRGSDMKQSTLALAHLPLAVIFTSLVLNFNPCRILSQTFLCLSSFFLSIHLLLPLPLFIPTSLPFPFSRLFPPTLSSR